MRYPAPSKNHDFVDKLIARWAVECPQLDVQSTHVVGRMLRLGYFSTRMEDAVLERYGMHMGEFNLLAALRRSGAPYELPPNQLQGFLLVSSSALTHRIDQVEAAGWVKRRPDPNDRRSIQIRLTRSGKQVVDEAIIDVLACERQILKPLSSTEQATLSNLLRRLAQPIEMRDERPPVLSKDAAGVAVTKSGANRTPPKRPRR